MTEAGLNWHRDADFYWLTAILDHIEAWKSFGNFHKNAPCDGFGIRNGHAQITLLEADKGILSVIEIFHQWTHFTTQETPPSRRW